MVFEPQKLNRRILLLLLLDGMIPMVLAGAEFTVTKGNNVDAYEDGNNPGYQPDGGAYLDFTGYPFNEIYTNTNQYEDCCYYQFILLE